MKYAKNSILPLLIFSLTLSISCRQPKPVRFTGYRNFTFSSHGFTNGILKAELSLYNPNSYPMKIKAAHVNIFLNHAPLGQITQDSLQIMPAKDTFLMPIRIKVNLLKVAGNLLSAAGGDSLLIEAKGSCKVGRSGIFVKLPLHYQQKQVLH